MTEQVGRWLTWTWRHFSMTVDDHETLADALSASWWTADAGNGSLECIEGPDGVVPAEVVEADHAARAEASLTEFNERMDTLRARTTHVVSVQSPGGKWAWVGNLPEAADEVDRLRAVLPPERIDVKPVEPAAQQTARRDPSGSGGHEGG